MQSDRLDVDNAIYTLKKRGYTVIAPNSSESGYEKEKGSKVLPTIGIILSLANLSYVAYVMFMVFNSMGDNTYKNLKERTQERYTMVTTAFGTSLVLLLVSLVSYTHKGEDSSNPQELLENKISRRRWYMWIFIGILVLTAVGAGLAFTSESQIVYAVHAPVVSDDTVIELVDSRPLESEVTEEMIIAAYLKSDFDPKAVSGHFLMSLFSGIFISGIAWFLNRVGTAEKAMIRNIEPEFDTERLKAIERAREENARLLEAARAPRLDSEGVRPEINDFDRLPK